MADKVEDLYEELMMLSEDERKRLRELLNQTSAGDFASPEIARAWREECDRRVEAMDRGDMDLIPHDEVFQRIRGRLSG